MKEFYYELKQLPDLTLNKYAALGDNSVEGVLEKQKSFLRQLHRKAFNPGDPSGGSNTIRWIFCYDPKREAGRRMRVLLKLDLAEEAAEFADSFIGASAIAPYFSLSPVRGDELDTMLNASYYAEEAFLIKKEKFAMAPAAAAAGGRRESYYSVNEWKIHEEARLFGLTSMMKKIGAGLIEAGDARNAACVYVVSAVPVDYSVFLDDDAHMGRRIAYMRGQAETRLERGGGLASFAPRNEGASFTLKRYEKLVETLAETPHFRVGVSAYAQSREYARMLLDAAGSEALKEGSYEIRCRETHTVRPLREILREDVLAQRRDCHLNAPKDLSFWPTLFTLEELQAFTALPALFPGESVELPKETAPVFAAPDGEQKNSLFLGWDMDQHEVRLPFRHLVKHAFISGMPGSGKTNTMLHIVTQLHRAGIPFLVFEPAKREYRALANLHLKDLRVFSPSAGTYFPLHLNPFEFPDGITLAEHIENLKQVFDGAFDLEPPMPFLLDQALEQVYRDLGWVPNMVNDGSLLYPTLQQLYDSLATLLDSRSYSDEVKGNLRSVLEVRIGSLLRRAMGDTFNVPRSTLRPADWLNSYAVLELESMGQGPANFLTLLLSTLIRETLKSPAVEDSRIDTEKPRHVLLFEEAHNLIGPSTEKGEKGDTKVAATAFIVKMLAEVRALGEGIIIADQLPSVMAPEVIKNTAFKLAHKLIAMDDRQLLGGAMSADETQLERMASYGVGRGLIVYDKLLKPFEIQIAKWAEDDALYDSPDDRQLAHELHLSGLPYEQDLLISHQLHHERLKKLEIGAVDALQAVLDRAITLKENPAREFVETLTPGINPARAEKRRREILTKSVWTQIGKDYRSACGLYREAEIEMELYLSHLAPEIRERFEAEFAEWKSRCLALDDELKTEIGNPPPEE